MRPVLLAIMKALEEGIVDYKRAHPGRNLRNGWQPRPGKFQIFFGPIRYQLAQIFMIGRKRRFFVHW